MLEILFASLAVTLIAALTISVLTVLVNDCVRFLTTEYGIKDKVAWCLVGAVPITIFVGCLIVFSIMGVR